MDSPTAPPQIVDMELHVCANMPVSGSCYVSVAPFSQHCDRNQRFPSAALPHHASDLSLQRGWREHTTLAEQQLGPQNAGLPPGPGGRSRS